MKTNSSKPEIDEARLFINCKQISQTPTASIVLTITKSDWATSHHTLYL